MDRRNFLKNALSATAGAFAVSNFGCSSGGGTASAESASDAEFYARCQALLKRWGGALADLQIKIKCPA